MTYRKQVWFWPAISVLFYSLWWQLEWIIGFLNHHACFTCWSYILSSYLLRRLRIGIRPFAWVITHYGGHSSSSFETLVSWSCQTHLKSTVFDSAFVCLILLTRYDYSFNYLPSIVVPWSRLKTFSITTALFANLFIYSSIRFSNLCTARLARFYSCALFMFSASKKPGQQIVSGIN